MTADPLVAFAAAVGPEDPVCICGGRTQWEVGGRPEPGVREVAAPAGVVAHEPAEMVVRVRAGTTLAETQAAVGELGQWVPLEAADPSRATVGGLLAVGRSGYRRLRYGPVRDILLEARFVSAGGELVRAGAPLVKNVTGYDLCRLLVGSLGTLGGLGEVVLRCVPRPEVARWWARPDADPFALFAALYRPAALLWDGTTTWAG
ncbi:MAG: FAD-binding oxidoreductase, partial [Acidimicrobiales bacterium]